MRTEQYNDSVVTMNAEYSLTTFRCTLQRAYLYITAHCRDLYSVGGTFLHSAKSYTYISAHYCRAHSLDLPVCIPAQCNWGQKMDDLVILAYTVADLAQVFPLHAKPCPSSKINLYIRHFSLNSFFLFFLQFDTFQNIRNQFLKKFKQIIL